MLILEWWKQLGKSRQIGFAAGAAAILGLIVVLSYFVFGEKYVPLLRDREMTDQGSVVAALEAGHAKYRVDAASGKLMVPEAAYEKARTLLQKQGLSAKPQNGFEVFDHSEFGMTDFAEKINYQRALEGEIARTVMGLEGIRYARVHLVLPDNSLFRKDKEPPKAVVTVDGEERKALTPEQIEGIQTLAASAVPGLAAGQVAILDHRGIELTDSASGGGREGFVQKRMRAKAITEGYLSEKIYRVLMPLFPGSQITVSVDADISLDRIVSSRDQVLSSRQGAGRSHSRTGQIKNVAGGDISRSATSFGAPAELDVGSQAGHVHDQVDQFPGEITRLSVAIVVPTADDAQIEQVQELVVATVGLDPTRGDLISVVPDAPVADGYRTEVVTNPQHDELIFPEKEPVDLLSLLVGNYAIAWVVGLLLIVIMICVLIISRLRKAELPAASSLNDEEREELLTQVRGWLRQADVKEEGA